MDLADWLEERPSETIVYYINISRNKHLPICSDGKPQSYPQQISLKSVTISGCPTTFFWLCLLPVKSCTFLLIFGVRHQLSMVFWIILPFVLNDHPQVVLYPENVFKYKAFSKFSNWGGRETSFFALLCLPRIICGVNVSNWSGPWSEVDFSINYEVEPSSIK